MAKSGLSLIPIDHDPSADDAPSVPKADSEDSALDTVGQNVAEFGKGIPTGAVTLVGTAAKGAAVLSAASPRFRSGIRLSDRLHLLSLDPKLGDPRCVTL